MIHKKLTEITLADIRQLIDLSVLESMTIEYKEKLNINTDNDKKELLKDLSAFANEDGGDLIIGIKEDKGIPTEIIGVRINDIDAATGSLTNLILDGIEPRINFEIHYIQYNEQNYVLIFRITKNYNAPHRVILKNHGHFYGKTSSIVRAYNTAQLRDKFNNEPLLNDKINQFTKDRLIKIKDGKIPIHFARFGKACLHIVPSDAFTIGNPLDIQKIFDNTFILNINGFIPQYNRDHSKLGGQLLKNVV